MIRLTLTISLALLLTATTGCMSVTNLEKELAKDPAAVHLEIHSLYGTVILDRNMPTNVAGFRQ